MLENRVLAQKTIYSIKALPEVWRLLYGFILEWGVQQL